MPPMGLPGNQGHTGLQYGTAAAMSNGVIAPQASNPTAQSHMFPQQPSSPDDSLQSFTSNIEVPDIVQWFQYLDWDERRNKDGITFVPYGITLKAKGFIRISQLTSEFVKLSDLQGWLGIEVGTTILILEYAKEDLATIKSGRWVFPKDQ